MPRILFVEDELAVTDTLKRFFQREGYDVFIARSLSEALDAYQRHPPDCVVLDVLLNEGPEPDKSGFDVCQELRADERIKDTLVLMLTAKGRDTDVDKGLGVGADAYMTKPFSTKELVAKVAQMLGAAS